MIMIIIMALHFIVCRRALFTSAYYLHKQFKCKRRTFAVHANDRRLAADRLFAPTHTSSPVVLLLISFFISLSLGFWLRAECRWWRFESAEMHNNRLTNWRIGQTESFAAVCVRILIKNYIVMELETRSESHVYKVRMVAVIVWLADWRRNFNANFEKQKRQFLILPFRMLCYDTRAHALLVAMIASAELLAAPHKHVACAMCFALHAHVHRANGIGNRMTADT